MADDNDDKKLEVVTHELKVPVEDQGEDITHITIRRPKLKDMKKVSSFRGTDADRAGKMIEILSGKSSRFVDELDGADVDAISKIIDSFS